MTLSLAVMWLPVALFSVMLGASRNLWEPLRAVGIWASPIYDDAFAVIGFIATVIVAVAAATGFSGDWSSLSRSARVPLQATLALCALVLLLLAEVGVPITIVDSTRLPTIILVFACGWIGSLVMLSVLAIATPEQRLLMARRDFAARRVRVHAWGYAVPTVRARVIRARAIVWGAPAVLWFAAGFIPVFAIYGDTPYLMVPFTISLVLVLPIALLVFGWAASADHSAGAAARFWTRAGFLVPALLLIVPIGWVLVRSPLGWMGWSAAAVSTCTVLALYPRAAARRIPWVRFAEAASTASGVRRAEAAYRAAREQLEGAREAPGTPVTASPRTRAPADPRMPRPALRRTRGLRSTRNARSSARRR
ncbi:hypothetical protein LK09_10420 [Microbacterium mangrovi]|uniref:Uncharacterized protein n=1 Tax=Microbacterium mangrovi TaxID=1348253 RepID=A0A0B2A291_9MICO|nr:hypothetical protein [Microbacterium mangrovi]KHK97619.1 hypothetical protein LK09_10420 [Microbacterium mangrovi]